MRPELATRVSYMVVSCVLVFSGTAFGQIGEVPTEGWVLESSDPSEESKGDTESGQGWSKTWTMAADRDGYRQGGANEFLPASAQAAAGGGAEAHANETVEGGLSETWTYHGNETSGETKVSYELDLEDSVIKLYDYWPVTGKESGHVAGQVMMETSCQEEVRDVTVNWGASTFDKPLFQFEAFGISAGFSANLGTGEYNVPPTLPQVGVLNECEEIFSINLQNSVMLQAYARADLFFIPELARSSVKSRGVNETTWELTTCDD